jgi:hypothetical protein
VSECFTASAQKAAAVPTHLGWALKIGRVISVQPSDLVTRVCTRDAVMRCAENRLVCSPSFHLMTILMLRHRTDMGKNMCLKCFISHCPVVQRALAARPQDLLLLRGSSYLLGCVLSNTHFDVKLNIRESSNAQMAVHVGPPRR